MSIGDELIQAGWRQGSIVLAKDVPALLKGITDNYDPGTSVIIIASQSCDIANNNLASDPIIEISIARKIANINGNYTYNKSARILHTQFRSLTLNDELEAIQYHDINIELKAYEKFRLDKSRLTGIAPDPDYLLENKQLDSYIDWLAARYSRPALPTEFNNRIIANQKKLKKIAKKINKQISGIYVEITPNEEISNNQNYNVNLLAVLTPNYSELISDIEKSIDEIAALMKDAGMVLSKPHIATEDKVSIATIKRFKRFYFDDLSFKEDTTHPVETKTNL